MAADLVRPGAVEQLALLGERIAVPVFSDSRSGPVPLVRAALRRARREGFGKVVVDTAGRLQVDRALMRELAAIDKAADPEEVLLVLDAIDRPAGRIGGEGLSRTHRRNRRPALQTRQRREGRGGHLGEGGRRLPHQAGRDGGAPEDLEVFHPERMASRILGMGDVLTLVEKAEQAFDEQRALEMADRVMKAEFTFDDFLEQVKGLRRMGSFGEVLGMIPGARTASADPQVIDREIRRSEAIIRSMTPAERGRPQGHRRQPQAQDRCGVGNLRSGCVGLLRQFGQVRNMMKSLSQGKGHAGLSWNIRASDCPEVHPGRRRAAGGEAGAPALPAGGPGRPKKLQKKKRKR